MRRSKFRERHPELRDDLWEAYANIIGWRIKMNLQMTLLSMNKMLFPEEKVLALGIGTLPANEGILVVTDLRIIALRDNMTGRQVKAMIHRRHPWPESQQDPIVFSHRGGMMSYVKIFHAANSIIVNQPSYGWVGVERAIDEINSRRSGL